MISISVFAISFPISYVVYFGTAWIILGILLLLFTLPIVIFVTSLYFIGCALAIVGIVGIVLLPILSYLKILILLDFNLCRCCMPIDKNPRKKNLQEFESNTAQTRILLLEMCIENIPQLFLQLWVNYSYLGSFDKFS